MLIPSYWTDHIKQAAGSAAAISITSRKNETGGPIKIISCIATSSGAVSTEGISIYRAINDESILVHHDKAALTAKETCAVPVPFVLQDGEQVKVTFDQAAAATDILELIVSGE